MDEHLSPVEEPPSDTVKTSDVDLKSNEDPVVIPSAEHERPGAVVRDVESDTSDEDDDDEEILSAEERIAKAESCKGLGNERFKSGENDEAIKMYEEGVQAIKPLVDKVPPELMETLKTSQVELHVSLLLNKSMAQLKLSKWNEAAKTSSLAIEQIEVHGNFMEDPAKAKVKGLFRRAQSLSKTGSLTEAKSDLVTLLKLDRSNKDALREYNRIKKRLAEIREQEKKSYVAAFEKVSLNGGMYKDKEVERKRKALKKIEEERLRREKWTKAIEENEEDKDLSFEDWCKKEDAKAEAKKKEEEEERRKRKQAEDQERAKRAAEERAKRKDDDQVELDEEDLKALATKKSYCYFRTEHTEEEKALLHSSGHSKPLKIQSTDSKDTQESDGVTSAWNANGTTWEERDITTTAKNSLEQVLTNVACKTDHGEIRVASVSKVDGHAQIVVTRSKPAPVLDMSAKVKWVLDPSDGSETVKGTASLPDISTGVLEDLDVSITVSSGDATAAQAQEFIKSLQDQIRATVCAWADSLN